MEQNALVELKSLASQRLSQREIGSRLGVSQTTVRYWFRKLGLEAGGQQPVVCRRCGEADPDKLVTDCTRRRYLCKACDSDRVRQRQLLRKAELVEYKGGRCSKCGYNRCYAALDFHHREAKDKDPRWQTIRTWTLKKAKAELDKCDLVCKNCHCEIHYGTTAGMV